MIIHRDLDFESAIGPYLSREDDPEFWVVALDILSRDFESIYSSESKKNEVFLQLGACSHWLRPHQTRLTAAGGFAYPSGYLGGAFGRDGLPELDWSVIFHRDRKENRWVQTDKFFSKRKIICRVALPRRTSRHNQAAVNVIWTPGTPEDPEKKLAMYYGFRKVDGEWGCVVSGEL
jgi:hypothetical protein